MITIVEINTSNYASTGNIMNNISKQARLHNINVFTCVKASKESFKYKFENQIYIGFRIERIVSSIMATVTGLRDHFNIIGTFVFIKKIKKINPDLIHLHVLHDNFINIKLLFKYLSKTNIPIIWTFHDCCAMTGKCPCFTMVKCEKWIDGCYSCPQLNEYTKSFFDTTRLIWNERKKAFTSIKNLTIVTPSKWLKSLVDLSYFNKYKTKLIYNGIDLSVYKNNPINNKDIKNNEKYIVLGVANVWNESKGLYDFIKLSKMLSNKYQIVLVGTNDEIDKILPNSITSIHRTYKQEDLVELYSKANVFVNPTKQEVFGLVNVEALACGTPVITYDVGGCSEIITEKCGIKVELNNINMLKEKIEYVCINKPFNKNDCINRANDFDIVDKANEYIKLYKELLCKI